MKQKHALFSFSKWGPFQVHMDETNPTAFTITLYNPIIVSSAYLR